MNIRPYRLVGDSILLKAQNHFLMVIEKWCEDWKLNISSSLTCNRTEIEGKHPCSAYACYKNEEKQVWIDLASQNSIPSLLARELFSISLMEGASDREDGMAASAAKRIAADLVERIVSSCELITVSVKSTEEAFSSLYMPGAGTLSLHVNIGSCAFDILLNGACVTQLFPHGSRPIALPETVEMRDALSDVPMSLLVELGCVEASVASVLTLNVGDVVKLDSPVDLPLAVKNDGEAVLFHAYLGRQERNLAIEVVNRGNI